MSKAVQKRVVLKSVRLEYLNHNLADCPSRPDFNAPVAWLLRCPNSPWSAFKPEVAEAQHRLQCWEFQLKPQWLQHMIQARTPLTKSYDHIMLERAIGSDSKRVSLQEIGPKKPHPALYVGNFAHGEALACQALLLTLQSTRSCKEELCSL